MVDKVGQEGEATMLDEEIRQQEREVTYMDLPIRAWETTSPGWKSSWR